MAQPEPAKLGLVGAQLSLTVSFTIASELRDAALSAGVHLDELIMLVTAIYLCITRLKNTVKYVAKSMEVPNNTNRTTITFLQQLVTSTEEITMSLAVQLVVRSIAARTSILSVRVVGLVAVAIFFLYIKFGANMANVQNKEA